MLYYAVESDPVPTLLLVMLDFALRFVVGITYYKNRNHLASFGLRHFANLSDASSCVGLPINRTRVQVSVSCNGARFSSLK
jgi:hypothetical protein